MMLCRETIRQSWDKKGARAVLAMKSAEGKRLMYKTPIEKPSTDPKPGEQLPPFPL